MRIIYNDRCQRCGIDVVPPEILCGNMNLSMKFNANGISLRILCINFEKYLEKYLKCLIIPSEAKTDQFLQPTSLIS